MKNPLVHYARHGREPHIDLVPDFGQQFYVARNPEVLRDSTYTPLEHYIRHGRAEGRRGLPRARLDRCVFRLERTDGRRPRWLFW